MQTRSLPGSDLRFSALTFGTMRFASKDPDDHASVSQGKRALSAALDAGINTVHSSYEYGTRWVLDEFLGEHPKRHELQHMIKVASPEYTDGGFSEAQFRETIETALRELHTEHITLVQHLQRGVPKPIIYDSRGDGQRLAQFDSVTEDLLAAFDKLKDEGKVGHLTTFPHTLGFAERAIASGQFEGMVSFFNVVENDLLDHFPRMAEQGMHVFAMRPFLQGMLNSRRAESQELLNDSPFGKPEWAPHLRRLERIRPLVREAGIAWDDLALRFALHPAIVPSVIVSMNREEQVARAVAAIEGPPLDDALVMKIREVSRDIPLAN
ncbi:aldo/keto reductase [Halomonas sp. MA07-2]|uniref:aldo/keto reductase n=1 Tax=Halomonas sp. MA07-2 TaxID=3440841 RepID=UPI003EEE68D6